MPRKPDWNALGKLFARPSSNSEPVVPDVKEGDCVIYNGEQMPKWLAWDLMRERAAIYEFEAGLPRAEADDKALNGLKK